MADDEQRILEDIRKLLIFILLKQGFKQSELADVLGVSQPKISKMFSKKSSSSNKKEEGD